MKKKLLICLAVLSLTLSSMLFFVACSKADDIYYTTQDGIELTKEQYDNLTKVYTQEELDVLPPPFIEQNKNDPNLKLAGGAYYTTRNGIELTREQYNKLRKDYTLEEIEVLDESTINKHAPGEDLDGN
ncbi:hypothetical protein M2140_001128 [Clostridiales Family XIII bacterium PM5-7]